MTMINVALKQVTVSQRNIGKGYRVTKTVNTTDPRVYALLDEIEVNTLIDSGVRVTVTK